jgi:hypothetical protein
MLQDWKVKGLVPADYAPPTCKIGTHLLARDAKKKDENPVAGEKENTLILPTWDQMKGESEAVKIAWLEAISCIKS